MRRAGVGGAGHVVCYDHADGTAAARGWWVLRWFGHRSVQVLDGGYAGWTAAGGPVTTEVPLPAPGDFTAAPGRMPVVDAEEALAVAASGRLLDARTTERFAGEQEPIDPVAGHVPGAVSAPTTDNVDGSGRFRSPAALRRRFESLGVQPGGRVATYCGSGVTACHQVLALELAGVTAALYPDSWSGWITDPSRPVATGRW
jgi:thiosulfate/3-mercaptopyruvate sulfurtransferase